MIEILKKAKLIKVQRNKIYDTILHNGFIPENFLIEEVDVYDDNSVTTIKFFLRETPELRFLLHVDSTNLYHYWGSFSPGERVFENRYNGEWSEMIESLVSWLNSLKIELELEEKWERLHLNPEIKFIAIDRNEKFTDEDSVRVNKKLDQFKKRIVLLEIPEEAKVELVEKADDLKKQTKILSKVNWQQLFIGIIVNTVVRLSLTRESAALIWNTVKSIFSNLILSP